MRLKIRLLFLTAFLLGGGLLLAPDVMKRIAAPNVGGVVTSGIMELAIYPIIFYLWRGRRLPQGGPFIGFHHYLDRA